MAFLKRAATPLSIWSYMDLVPKWQRRSVKFGATKLDNQPNLIDCHIKHQSWYQWLSWCIGNGSQRKRKTNGSDISTSIKDPMLTLKSQVSALKKTWVNDNKYIYIYVYIYIYIMYIYIYITYVPYTKYGIITPFFSKSVSPLKQQGHRLSETILALPCEQGPRC